MAANKRSARRWVRRAASETVVAGKRDTWKIVSQRTKCQEAGEITLYRGLAYAGSILAKAGRWLAFDEHGHRLGTFSREREAADAVYAAGGGR